MGRAFDAMRAAIERLPAQNIADMARLGFGRSDIVPLWFGEGDLATPDFICDAAADAMHAGHTFYTHQNGIPELREALAAYLGRLHAKPIATERITVTPGGMAGILLSLEMILDAGDNVVVIDPVWPNIRGAIQILGGEARSVRLDQTEGRWRFDLDRVAAAMDGRTRAVFLASPGNPTGWVMRAEEQAALLALCRARGVWIIADEVYARFHYGQAVAPSMLDHAAPEDLVCVVNSFSKAWCMTGWRLGWLCHPASCERTLAMLIQYNSSGVATFLQYGGMRAITEGEPFVAALVERTRRGRDIVYDALRNLPRIGALERPEGGMYVYFEVAGMTGSTAACAAIFERTGVGVAPGFAFGDDSYLRICCCNDLAKLETAMERIRPEFM